MNVYMRGGLLSLILGLSISSNIISFDNIIPAFQNIEKENMTSALPLTESNESNICFNERYGVDEFILYERESIILHCIDSTSLYIDSKNLDLLMLDIHEKINNFIPVGGLSVTSVNPPMRISEPFFVI